MENAPLGTVKTIRESERDTYVMNALRMIDKASLAEDEKMYEYWSRWALWYFDIVSYSFYSKERPQMYDALDSALISKNMIEARRLISSCLKI
jgi:hypothetical protein